MQVMPSQLHFLANKNAELATPPLFWPVNCIKIGGHVALLSDHTVYSLYCDIVAEFILMAFLSCLDFKLLLRVKSSKFENSECVLTLSPTPSPLMFQYTPPLYRISKIIHMYHTFSPISIWNLHIFVGDDIVRKLVWC